MDVKESQQPHSCQVLMLHPLYQQPDLRVASGSEASDETGFQQPLLQKNVPWVRRGSLFQHSLVWSMSLPHPCAPKATTLWQLLQAVESVGTVAARLGTTQTRSLQFLPVRPGSLYPFAQTILSSWCRTGDSGSLNHTAGKAGFFGWSSGLLGFFEVHVSIQNTCGPLRVAISGLHGTCTPRVSSVSR